VQTQWLEVRACCNQPNRASSRALLLMNGDARTNSNIYELMMAFL
jgi:hypothetical protein